MPEKKQQQLIIFRILLQCRLLLLLGCYIVAYASLVNTFCRLVQATRDIL